MSCTSEIVQFKLQKAKWRTCKIKEWRTVRIYASLDGIDSSGMGIVLHLIWMLIQVCWYLQRKISSLLDGENVFDNQQFSKDVNSMKPKILTFYLTWVKKLLVSPNCLNTLTFAFVPKPRQNLTSKRKKNDDTNFWIPAYISWKPQAALTFTLARLAKIS